MNLAELRLAVATRIGVPARDAMFPPAVLNDVVNQAIAALDDEALWPWMERTVTADLVPPEDGVLVPEDWKATKSVVLLQPGGWNQELFPVTSTDALRYAGTGGVLPYAYNQQADAFILVPAPPSPLSVALIYYAWEPLLIADTDEPNLPRRFLPVVVSKAASLASLREDDRSASAVHLADYTAGVTRMRRSMRATTRPTTIKVRPGGWV